MLYRHEFGDVIFDNIFSDMAFHGKYFVFSHVNLS